MTLKGEMALILHYFTEIGSVRAHCLKVNYLVWPHQQDAHQRGLGLSGLIHKEAHPTASTFS